MCLLTVAHALNKVLEGLSKFPRLWKDSASTLWGHLKENCSMISMCISKYKNPPAQPEASLRSQPSDKTSTVSWVNHFVHPLKYDLCCMVLIPQPLTFSSVVLVGFNLELHSTLNINQRLLLSTKKQTHSSSCLLSDWDVCMQLTTASTAGDVSPTTNKAGHLHRNTMCVNILKSHCSLTNKCLFVSSWSKNLR